MRSISPLRIRRLHEPRAGTVVSSTIVPSIETCEAFMGSFIASTTRSLLQRITCASFRELQCLRNEKLVDFRSFRDELLVEQKIGQALHDVAIHLVEPVRQRITAELIEHFVPVAHAP